MKYSQGTLSCSESVRFFVLLIMCCTILVHISAAENLKNDHVHDTRQELPRSIRQRRAIRKNGTTNPREIEKRLKIIEQRLDALLSYPHGSCNGLLAYLLGQKSQDKGNANSGPPGPPGMRGQKGIIGGEHYTHYGGGSQYLCLPRNPKYDKYQNGRQMAGSVYGTEYEVSQYNGNPFDRNLHNHDAPCAVCFVKSRGSMLMMPARNDCPSGWTEEYHGYLMSAKTGHTHSTEFVCVDGNPEYVLGSKQNNNGALLYPVEGVCGSLPCPPYVEGRELTCAVCTK
ncbi:uncharacterized protein [Acropora muricata]|uniref:uncharacterized protein isoform X3 n=1 Tax=Acropora muricata TaxID=159855 RepID=UPI0034E5F8D7